MTTTRPIILRELPATKTTDEAELARAAPYRYSAEWETPDGIDDEVDPLWGAIGFGPTEATAHADLIAQTARNFHRQPDEVICDALGELSGDMALMSAAIGCAERYASIAFNTASGEPGTNAGLLVQLGQAWTDTAAALRRVMAATCTHTSMVECDAGAAPEVARALGELFLALPSEVKWSPTFGLSFKGSDGRIRIAVVATRDPSRLAEFVRMGLIEPASDTPLSDCPQHIADQLTDEVTFTAPDGRAFTGRPVDVGIEVAEALLKHDGETWWLPSVIREHAAEHLAQVVDGLRWDPADRPKAQRAALHLYCLINAEPDEARAQRLAALNAGLAPDKTTRQSGESDEALRARVKAAAPKVNP